MPEETYAFTPAAKLMQAHEIEQLAQLFVQQGVTKIRLTGGEPLVRKDAADIMRRLSQLGVELTMTTNGVRVHEFVGVMQAAQINSVNISLDTLDPNKFLLITRRDQFKQVYDNIHLLLALHFKVKINVVVMKGVNDHEINDFIAWTKDVPIEVRFIEFMPFAGNQWTTNKVVTLAEILVAIGTQHSFSPLHNEKNATAKCFKVDGHAGKFSVISTMSANFCGTCNRLRLTADGKMKNCLFAKNETDLLGALRKGEDVLPLLQANIKSKPKELGGQLQTDFTQLDAAAIENRSMITIGG